MRDPTRRARLVRPCTSIAKRRGVSTDGKRYAQWRCVFTGALPLCEQHDLLTY